MRFLTAGLLEPNGVIGATDDGFEPMELAVAVADPFVRIDTAARYFKLRGRYA